MDERHYGLYEAIVAATDSEVILFFIIVAVVMAVVVAPLYIASIKDRKYSRKHENEKHDKYIEREREIIDVMRDISAVIAENTAVTTTLKGILETHGTEPKQAVERIHERIDQMLGDIAEIKTLQQTTWAAISNHKKST